ACNTTAPASPAIRRSERASAACPHSWLAECSYAPWSMYNSTDLAQVVGGGAGPVVPVVGGAPVPVGVPSGPVPVVCEDPVPVGGDDRVRFVGSVSPPVSGVVSVVVVPGTVVGEP